jgi:hypothetical protein
MGDLHARAARYPPVGDGSSQSMLPSDVGQHEYRGVRSVEREPGAALADR